MIIEVKLKNGKILYLRANWDNTDMPPCMNGAPQEALALLKQLPAEVLASEPRILFQ